MATVENNNVITAVFAPGTVAKQTAFDMPAYYPEIQEILGAATYTLTTGTPDTWTTQALTSAVYSATPSANTICRVDGNSVIMGDASTTSTLLVLTYRSY